jgi:four helix bundle protein
VSQTNTAKIYDLEERTLACAQELITFTNNLKKTIPNVELLKQVVRSGGSVGANYIEANEALSRKDFTMRIKICRKEAKESIYWLKLLEIDEKSLESKRQSLINEYTELMKIFGAIIEKTK